MGWFDNAEESHREYQEYSGEEHQAKLSHEVLAGAAAFGAFKVFEDRQRSEGKPVSHAFAKEVLAGLAAAETDKLVESKGLDWVDREKAKHHAKKNAERMYEEHYGEQDRYDPERVEVHESFSRYNGW
ncbi:hypothetical protein FN846DRAFT_967326 [Sphaerosporella brunnea]|uniref:CipC-like antibiotic response protein n=1 Tax=Sphaerosporella brunnea TaxID=1250544 RepID=A0A5J5EL47_9PEZI|nr:hypothetical protein FN846DRAFT_967326 [Sphaerosporella brunnea]